MKTFALLIYVTFISFGISFAISFSVLIVPARAQAATANRLTTIVFIGDSIAEGYGVKKDQAFPDIAGAILNGAPDSQKSRVKIVKIVNGGISGSVSADADRRVKWFLKLKPDVLVLELGSNDALKGTPISVIRKNLEAALKVAEDAHLKVLILGMKIYTNFGPDYAKSFNDMYAALAKEHHSALVPFLLEDVAMKPGLMQADQKHPNVEGHKIVGARVAAALEKIL